jgi:hypothetical protein
MVPLENAFSPSLVEEDLWGASPRFADEEAAVRQAAWRGNGSHKSFNMAPGRLVERPAGKLSRLRSLSGNDTPLEEYPCNNDNRTRALSDTFPIRIPDRLPKRIAKCPIVEAATEVRFVSPVPEAALQGLLFAQIRKRYPKYVQLPGAALTTDMRALNPILQYAPVAQYHSPEFIIQTGPRAVALLVQPAEYPGWGVLSAEIAYFFEALKNADFVSEGERLGLRYVNFFAFDVLPNLDVELLAHGNN